MSLRSGLLSTSNAHQVSTIEFSLVEVSVVHGLKQGNEVLREIQKELRIENVEKLMQETYEAQQYQRVSPMSCMELSDSEYRKFLKCSQIR